MSESDKQLHETMRELIEIEEKRLRAASWLYSFSHGVWAGIGGTVGVAIVLTLLSALLQHASVIPVIGHWLSELTPYVQTAIHR